MGLSNQDQVSIADSSYIVASVATGVLYPIVHAASNMGLKKCFVTAQGASGSPLVGTVSFKLVAVDQAGVETDISAALNTLNSAIPATFDVSPTNVPKFGAVLDPNLNPAGVPVTYSGGAVYFFLNRNQEYIVPIGSTVCAKITTAASGTLSVNALSINLAYYEL